MKKACVLLLCIADSVFCLAQSTLTGIVVNNEDNPIGGVHVKYGNQGSISNTKGRFAINILDSLPSFELTFSNIGYKTKKMKVYNGEKDIIVILEDSVVILEDITIRSAKYGRIGNYAAQTTPLKPLDIYTSPTALGDIIGAQKIMPGVQSNENDGRLIIQGGGVDEAKVYIDGLLLHKPYSLSSKNSSVRSRFSPDIFSGISLQSAGFSAQFGNALSGILSLNTLDALKTKLDFNLNTTGLESSIIHNKKSNAFRMNASYMNLSPYGSVMKDDYNWSKYFTQSSFNWFSIHKINNIKLKANISYSDAKVAYQIDDIDNIKLNNDFSEQNFLGNVVMDMAVNPQWKMYVGVNCGYNYFKGTDVNLSQDNVADKSINSHIKASLLYHNTRISNRVGVEDIFSKFDENYYYQNNYFLYYKNHSIAIFDELSIYLNEDWNLNVSGRVDYSSYLKRISFSPRVYLGYKINANNTLSFSTGRYSQLPSQELLKFSDKLNYCSAYNSTITYDYVKGASKLQLDVFYKKYDNLVCYEKAGIVNTNLTNYGKGESYGVSLFWKYNIQHLEWWLSASHIEADIRKDDYPTKLMPDYLSKNKLNITTKYWISNLKSMVGMSFFIDDGATFYNPRTNEKKHSPSRHQLDVSWSYLAKPGVIFHVGCKNIYGRKNVYGYEFSQIEPSKMRSISTSNKQFIYIGVFITFSKSKRNQLNSL